MKKGYIFISFILVILAGAFIAFHIYRNIIPMSPYDTGNSAGNLHNYGLVFEMDDKVYFANPYDSNCLYSMDPDGTHSKRLTNMGVKYISGANGILYFYMDSSNTSGKVTGLGSATNQYGVYRYNTKTGDLKCLAREMCGEVQLCGEYLYYQVKTDGGYLEKIKVNKTDKKVVYDEMASPVCYDNGIIFYSGVTKDHSIHMLYTQNGDYTRDFLTGYYFFPVVKNGYIYFMNGESNYSLWRASLLTGIPELVTSDRIDFYTIDDRYIYYAYSSETNPALKRCNLDGSDPVVLYNGIVNSLNTTSRELYFKVYGNDEMMYHMPLDGSRPAEMFLPQ
ncbi:MAG: DUF5050 domain-containing protein [Butyrivibrio sp.]|jgi:hypothetical protein|uniref:DUF5050 domain-containing protein n=1 Tax=Butyrivibrio sp. TaxID=28121 RepID=UPI001ECC7126|nr:DUF5050 domain-containing protein [Butyrivibrio sp.]MBE5841813.1 DUF5050 domain-containing protein [Butyrivibrio sp.]